MMIFSSNRRVACAFLAATLSFSTFGAANAGPLGVARPILTQTGPQIDQIRYRPHARHAFLRRHHRRGAGAAAVFGMFGAVLGAAIANSRREDDGYYGAPVYSPEPGYAPDAGYYVDQPAVTYAPGPVYRSPGPVYQRRGPVYRQARPTYQAQRQVVQAYRPAAQPPRQPDAHRGRGDRGFHN